MPRRAVVAAARSSLVFWCFAIVGTAGAFAQEPEGKVPIRCETFCSPSKLRTAVARLSWIDPKLKAPDAVAPTAPGEFSIETTIFKEGFADDVFAVIGSAEPGTRAAPMFDAEDTGPQALRAFELEVTSVVQPQIQGVGALDVMASSPEQLQTSVTIENLEPGLTYFWRLRLPLDGRSVESEVVRCVAPICVADMQEEE